MTATGRDLSRPVTFLIWYEAGLMIVDDYPIMPVPAGAVPGEPPPLVNETVPTTLVECSADNPIGQPEPASDLEPVIP